MQAVDDIIGTRYKLYAILCGVRYRLYTIPSGSDTGSIRSYTGPDPDSVRSYGDQIQAAHDLVGIGYRVYRTL